MSVQPCSYRSLGLFGIFLVFLFLETALQAEISLPRIFGSHMVLQQGVTIPVWGWGTAGEKITVKLGSSTASTETGVDGVWRVKLPPVKAEEAKVPLTLSVSGTNTVTFNDILIGEVWVASGQSNMELGMQHDSQVLAGKLPPPEPQIRLFLVSKVTALEAQKDLPAPKEGTLEGTWQLCSAETLLGKWGWFGFTAVGYYFAHEIQAKTGGPVGLIETSWGGTPAQAWTSLSALQNEPILGHYVEDHENTVKNLATAQADYPAKKAEYDKIYKAWNDEVNVPYLKAVDDWQKQAAEAKKDGLPPPERPALSQPKPKSLMAPDGGQNGPSNLFNSMIAPLIPFAIKGVIWYQGEANASKAQEYATLFPTMIKDWRARWQEGDFPFLYVQLANFQAPQKNPSEGGWAEIRESQLKTLALANTGMATAIDIGNTIDIHPKDKSDVGHRLALWARKLAYGEDTLVASGPLYQSMQVEGKQIRLTFSSVGDGLKIGVPPWTPDGIVPVPAKELQGFAIAGEDKKWVWAKAVIDGKTVVVSSDQVADPVAVRYDWANCPFGNLYNQSDLPTSSFRTDNW